MLTPGASRSERVQQQIRSICGACADVGAMSRTVHLPLQRTSGGVLTTGVFIEGELFRVIVDTGSPYLVVPLDDCERQPPRLSAFGCANRGQFRPSGAPPTSEQYGALPGRVEWLTGDVAFGETGA